jgi:hypothetical protein
LAKGYDDLRAQFKVGAAHEFTPLPTNPLRRDEMLDEDMPHQGHVTCEDRLACLPKIESNTFFASEMGNQTALASTSFNEES